MDAKTPFRGFVYGGLASCLAESCMMPLDVLKVRMQLQGEQGQRVYRHVGDAAIKIGRTEGWSAFFKGLKPAILRQATYGSLRVGLYGPTKQMLGVSSNEVHLRRRVSNSGTVQDSTETNVFRKVLAGILSGSLAAFICNPTDLIKVRMQADGMRSSSTGSTIPSYRGVFHAASTILRKEGLRGVYTGVGPTTTRAAVVAAAELVTYDEVKLYFLRKSLLPETENLIENISLRREKRKYITSDGVVLGPIREFLYKTYGTLGLHQDGTPLHIASGLVAGLTATAACSPFDVIKSRVMSQPLNKQGRGLWYSSMFDCWAKCLKTEGIVFMWRGFWPSYLSKGPTVVLFFILYEKIRILGDEKM